MNANDHINVVFRKFAYSLMSRATASLSRIVTAIVNNDTNSNSYGLLRMEIYIEHIISLH